MTSVKKDDLRNIEKLRKEIRAIEVSIDRMRATDLTDYYKDYRYNPKGAVKSLHGIGVDRTELQRKEKRLKSRLRLLQCMVTEAERYVGTIEDPELRAILRMYYVEGMTQVEIGAELHYEQSWISRKIKHFFMME